MLRIGIWGRLAAMVVCVAVSCRTGTSDSATLHVSPHGSNTPPFETYAEAANSVADAVLASSGYGDTVLVHAGVYPFDTTIEIPAGLTWAGVDRDSVILDWVDLEYRPGRLADLGGDNEVYGIEFRFAMGTSFNPSVTALYAFAPDTLLIHHCRFRSMRIFVDGNGSLNVFESEFVYGISKGMDLGVGNALIHHNSFFGKTSGDAIVCALAGHIVVEQNVFNQDPVGRPDGVVVDLASFIEVRNNLILNSARPVAIRYASGIIENNTMITAVGVPGGSVPHNAIRFFLRSYETLTIRNNAMIDFAAPIEFGNSCESCTTGVITYVHNAFWPPVDSFYRPWPDDPPSLIKVLDSANFNAYPMFTAVEECGAVDSGFLLQYASPLIDAGDRALLDTDGSRSDIGWWGGPQGSSYEYIDQSPPMDESLQYDYVYPVTSLSWSSSQAADLIRYDVHRGDASGFAPGPGNRVGSVTPPDSTFMDTLGDSLVGTYYRVLAVDSSGLSCASNEVAVVTTGVSDPWGTCSGLPRTPCLMGVYPNPFNVSTSFRVWIPAIGASPAAVKISVYDVLGHRVAIAFDGAVDPGRHDISWEARDSSGSEFATGVYFARLHVWNQVFGETIKLILLK